MREYQKATVQLDCRSFEAEITFKYTKLIHFAFGVGQSVDAGSAAFLSRSPHALGRSEVLKTLVLHIQNYNISVYRKSVDISAVTQPTDT